VTARNAWSLEIDHRAYTTYCTQYFVITRPYNIHPQNIINFIKEIRFYKQL